jgi:hypothetical protein
VRGTDQYDDHRDEGDGEAAAEDVDGLVAARDRLEAVNQLPVTQRPAAFAEINAAIAEELALMDEV